MSNYYYEDPIEAFELQDGDYYDSHNAQQHTTNTHGADFYEDDLELEYALSSPSPMGTYNEPYGRQHPNHNDHHQHTFSQPELRPRATNTFDLSQRVSHISQISEDNSRNIFRRDGSSNNYRQSQQLQASKEDLEHEKSTDDSGEQLMSNPRNGHGVRLRPVSNLPDIYRSLFKFGVFNAVQSTCFDEVIHGDKNLVISAPTGSGKTVLFELAIIRCIEESKKSGKQVKCIYIAPTKALCTEKFQDWAAKFEPIGFKCCELTGDTVVFGNSAWGEAKNASIIVTTCEKWDSLTRNWHDHDHILSQIELFLVDEVHILNETRGSTLEVVTSRMKLRGSKVRFLLVSATVPNIWDVAQWIGNGFRTSEPAQVFEFGEDYRPCKLTRHVVGVPRKNGNNDFQFSRALDFKLFATLQQYSTGKPILVFCSTRKGVFDTAEQLKKEFLEIESKRTALPWSRPTRINQTFVDKRLDELASVGIGVHHAGLSMEDRRSTEQLYLKQVLRILVATSTLAVGVNLPAHMVVIKGVHTFSNNASREYSDLDIMQMLGRAGRPQFDKDGIAVILCATALEAKYRALVQGKTILESSLHLNLAEHLNSEIGLGTINDIESAKSWLHSTFLYQRMRRNPIHYVGSIQGSQGSRQDGDELVSQSIAQLSQAGLVKHVEYGNKAGQLSSTQYGDIMSKYYIRRKTMEVILNLPERSTLREILETVCGAEEFQDCKLRASEKTLFNKLRKDIDIRFEVKKVEKTSDKVFLLVQAVLGGVSWNTPEYKSSDSQPHLETFTVFKHIARIAKAALDVAIVKKDGAKVKHSLELVRCLSAKAWEDRAIVLRQIEQIGEKSIKVLAECGITSFEHLRKQNPLRIETLLNRRSPFGLDLLSSLSEFPRYTLEIKELDVHSDGGKNPVQVDLLVECALLEERSNPVKSKKPRNRTFNTTAVLTLTSDMDFIDLRRIPTKALKSGKSFEMSVELKKPSQSVVVLISPESMAGMVLEQVYKPSIPPSEYPVVNTRPISSMDMDLEGLDDDPDFWNMTIDSGSPMKMKPEPEVENPETEIPEKQTYTSSKRRQVTHGPQCRPDGRYDCNHTCKDKTKCRHLCCRDGLPGPPNISKKKAHAAPDVQETAKPPSKVQRLHPSVKEDVRTKENQCIEQLDRLHERTQSTSNIRPSSYMKRLKMDPPQLTKRKHQAPIEYNISFTDLKDHEKSSVIDIPDAFSDDDLPATIMLSSAPQGPQDKVYAGDSFWDNPGTSDAEVPHAADRKPSQERPKKRPRHETLVSSMASEAFQTLFIPESSDSEGDVEIVPPETPPRKRKTPRSWYESPMKKSESKQPVVDSPRLFGRLNTAFTNPTKPPSQNLASNRTLQQPTIPDVVDDEFAELDAWLESGAVEIV